MRLGSRQVSVSACSTLYLINFPVKEVRPVGERSDDRFRIFQPDLAALRLIPIDCHASISILASLNRSLCRTIE